jgi:hypothetical protein
MRITVHDDAAVRVEGGRPPFRVPRACVTTRSSHGWSSVAHSSSTNWASAAALSRRGATVCVGTCHAWRNVSASTSIMRSGGQPSRSSDGPSDSSKIARRCSSCASRVT